MSAALREAPTLVLRPKPEREAPTLVLRPRPAAAVGQRDDDAAAADRRLRLKRVIFVLGIALVASLLRGLRPPAPDMPEARAVATTSRVEPLAADGADIAAPPLRP